MTKKSLFHTVTQTQLIVTTSILFFFTLCTVGRPARFSSNDNEHDVLPVTNCQLLHGTPKSMHAPLINIPYRVICFWLLLAHNIEYQRPAQQHWIITRQSWRRFDSSYVCSLPLYYWLQWWFEWFHRRICDVRQQWPLTMTVMAHLWHPWSIQARNCPHHTVAWWIVMVNQAIV